MKTLARRQAAFDSLHPSDRHGKRRPGSQNPHKQGPLEKKKR